MSVINKKYCAINVWLLADAEEKNLVLSGKKKAGGRAYSWWQPKKTTRAGMCTGRLRKRFRG